MTRDPFSASPPFPADPSVTAVALLGEADIPSVARTLLDALAADDLPGLSVVWRDAAGVTFEPPAAFSYDVLEALPIAGRVPADASLHALDNEAGVAAAWLVGEPRHAPLRLTLEQRYLASRAGQRIGELQRLERLSASVQRLGDAEKLQRALFAIADLAGSDRAMNSMLRGLHEIIGQLMYAENFYIALYDPVHDTLSFLYYADTVDEDDPTRHSEVPLSEFAQGITWYLIRDGKPLMGSTERLREQVSGELRVRGVNSHDFLGVPMLREGQVVGALAVQSYLPGIAYSAADQALLAFVADHVLTALERKQGQARLEQRVEERTHQLAEANVVLQRQMRERERAEHLQATLYRIAALSNTEESSERFYEHIHAAVAELINAENFYIALLSDDGQRLDFPYFVDASGDSPVSRPLGHGLTEYVIRNGRSLLADPEVVQKLVDAGEVSQPLARSSPAHFWLGVPLLASSGVIGVVAVQSYRSDLRYSASEAELLEFVSYQIASSLQRRIHAEALRVLNAQLEQRVEERTAELSEQIRVREHVEAQLKHQVMHDPLTGLPNRVYLRDRIERAISGQRRHASRQFALMYLDVDRFKLFNDSLGHLAGDEVLREIARRLIECVRDPDVVARLSGDEFAILLEDVPMPATACKVAQRIQASLQLPMQINGRALQTSASIGIAIGQSQHGDADSLLHDADTALYRAKAAGRQRFVLFDETLHRDAMDVLDVEHQLRAALVADEFVAHFQPIVRLEDGVTVGYETLVRWQHPQRGLLGPGEFLAVAEDSGLIEPIDWATYRAACTAGAGLVRDGAYLTINLCNRHFRNEDFPDRLLALVHETGFDPRQLRIEVTEGTLLGDTDAVVRILGKLRDAGIDAALDDFGTGYSSLGYLHRFPLRMIKIDRSFVSPLGVDGAGRSPAIVNAILALAGSLELEVVAEGVETAAQRDALIAMGCRYAQGWFYGRPKAAEAYERRGVKDG